MSLKFNPKDKIITIMGQGDIQLQSLRKGINDWVYSADGMHDDDIVAGSKTSICMILLDGWKLSSDNLISVIDGFIIGRDLDGDYYCPIADDSLDKIHIINNELDARTFVPSEAQKIYALRRGEEFAKDWELVTEPFPELKRKIGASNSKYMIFDLYWFCKQEFIRNKDIKGLGFPISGSNEIPREGPIRKWEWSNIWRINEDDLKYLSDGPLVCDGNILVPAREAEDPPYKQTTEVDKDSVTIGIITALDKEVLAVQCMLDNSTDYLTPGGVNKYKLGTIPAYDGKHVIALTKCEMGNTSSASISTMFKYDFPNVQVLIMVGIAGAVPDPDNPKRHVRLGDIVVSGKDGVFQYDYIKKSDKEGVDQEVIECRDYSMPPDVKLTNTCASLLSEYKLGNRSWMDELEKTKNCHKASRPEASLDILTSSTDSDQLIDHPVDDLRYENEPRIFIGKIGTGNILLKSIKDRDDLRDKHKILAVEMESGGVREAAKNCQIGYFTIRGTCDYCDINKNDVWHNYAAVIAAAYLRTLLCKTRLYPLRVPKTYSNR